MVAAVTKKISAGWRAWYPARRSGFLRHTALSAEGCCRQALTRFAAPRCAGRPPRPVPGQSPVQHRRCSQTSVSARWRGARAAESARLEIVCGETHRGFKSHPLRQKNAGRGHTFLIELVAFARWFGRDGSQVWEPFGQGAIWEPLGGSGISPAAPRYLALAGVRAGSQLVSDKRRPKTSLRLEQRCHHGRGGGALLPSEQV